MNRSKSNIARATKLVSDNHDTSAKEIATVIGVKMDSAHNLLYNARKKLRLYKVGRGKFAVWKQKARMQSATPPIDIPTEIANEIRKNIVSQVKSAAVQGTGAGQWSARKAQLVAKKYKAAGGGYRD